MEGKNEVLKSSVGERVDVSHLSKEERKARNRALKEARFAARRQFQIDKRKETKLAKKEELRNRKAADGDNEGKVKERRPIDEAEAEANRIKRLEQAALIRRERWALCKSHFKVIIDCDWEASHQKERLLLSLKQQFMYCQHVNKSATRPCELIFAGVGEGMRPPMEQVMRNGWIGAHLTSTPYEDLLSLSPRVQSMREQSRQEDQTRSGGEGVRGGASVGDTDADTAAAAVEGNTATMGELTGRPVYYLTADTDQVLRTVDPDAVYIIGGIVDRNSLKGATRDKAEAQGIPVRRLPIPEMVDMKTCHVLTVLHVFQILVQVGEVPPEEQTDARWRQVLESVLPQRKRKADAAASQP